CVMLLVEPLFKTLTKRELCDTRTHTEGLFALSVGSRREVDQLVKTAVAAGGSHAMEPQDHGFMYGWSFYDPDGHHWEVMWMDPQAMTAEPPQAEVGKTTFTTPSDVELRASRVFAAPRSVLWDVSTSPDHLPPW